MRRTTTAILLLLAAGPLRAQEAKPTPVSVAAAQSDVDQLHDAVASPAYDDFAVHARAAGFFDGIPSETPLIRPAPRGMDREPIDGREGSIDGMIDAAQKRYDLYKFSATEVPDAKLDAAIAYAKELRARKRVDFDAAMAENQMGEFDLPKDKSDGGAVKLNTRLPLMATRIGEAFCYAALVHEAAHAKALAEGRLDLARTVDNEVEAYRVEYLWLKVIDPSGQRMVVLDSTLKLRLEAHPEDALSRLSRSYVQHLLQLWFTNGEDAKLRDFVRRIGYGDGGVDPAATEIRA